MQHICMPISTTYPSAFTIHIQDLYLVGFPFFFFSAFFLLFFIVIHVCTPTHLHTTQLDAHVPGLNHCKVSTFFVFSLYSSASTSNPSACTRKTCTCSTTTTTIICIHPTCIHHPHLPSHGYLPQPTSMFFSFFFLYTHPCLHAIHLHAHTTCLRTKAFMSPIRIHTHATGPHALPTTPSHQ